ncbi:11795_t:CDS:2, partial [Funneliformis caledonium]
INKLLTVGFVVLTKAPHKPAWLGLPPAQAEPLFFSSAQLRS